MARETSKQSKTKAKSRAADGFVMMAMALVTLALGIGLVLQAGLSVGLAATVAVAFYLGLLSLHSLARRHDQLDQLKVEIEQLKGEVARLGGASAGVATPEAAARPPASGAMAAGAPALAPTGSPQPRSTAAPQNAAQAQSTQRIPAQQGAASKDAVADAAAGKDDRAVAGRPAAAPATYLGVPQPPPPSVVRAPQQANPARAPMPAAARTARGDSDADAAGRAAAPAFAGISRVPRNSNSEMAPAAAGSSSDADGKSAARAVAGEGRGATAKTPAFDADRAMPMSTPAEPALPGQREAGEEAWTYRPGDEMQPRGFSPRESDVEMIQGLIKKLADEVNSADAGKLASAAASPPRREVDEATLDQSVGALRRTAQTMKAPAAERAHEAAVLPPVPTHAAADHQGKSTTGAQSASLQGGEPEFDVEALMRRAEPIASMTSMPPPLPMASNAMSQAARPDRHDARDHVAFDADTAHEVAAFEAERRKESGAYGTDDAIGHELPDDGAAHALDLVEVDDRQGGDARWADAEDDTSIADEQRAAWADAKLTEIADAIEAGRVDVFLEPILDLGKQQPRHYEVSLSLRDATGAAIATDDESEADYPSGALPLLDSLRLSRTAHVARRLEERSKAGSVFSTFSGQSLTSDDFLTTFADTYDANERLAGQLILTFSQADVRRFRAPHWAMLREMRELGFGFAVRAVTDLDMDFAQLAGAGFKFAKLDAGVFLEGLPAPGAMVPAADICKYLAGEGLALVVEAIDDDAKRARVSGFGVLLGQGALFGGPRLMKAAAISGAQSAAA